MLMLDLMETVDQLAMANSVHWYGHVLRMEDGGNVLSWHYSLRLKVIRRKGVEEDMEEKKAEKESMKVGFSRNDMLCRYQWTLVVDLISIWLALFSPPSVVLETWIVTFWPLDYTHLLAIPHI